jgi:hypothetical protein
MSGARMAEDQNCPKCGLVNPPTAQRCDCGWDFVSRRQARSYLEPKQRLPIAAGIGGGIILVIILVRVLLTLLTAGPQ